MADFKRDELLHFERLAIRGWPARETADINGWLWRSTGGGSIRANAVSTLEFHGGDVEAAIDAVEMRYRALGEPTRFVISDIVAPVDLDQRLAARGYNRVEDCTTLAKRIEGSAAPLPDMRVSEQPSLGWQEVYLAGVSDDRRSVALSILARVPAPRAFFALGRPGEVISCGLGVLADDVCSVQCMATRPGARRQGGGSSILKALEAWAWQRGAGTLFLQTNASNAAAQALYARAGFRLAGRYHVRIKGLAQK